MKIVLLGDFSLNLDEGFKNTSHYLGGCLEAYGDDVTRLNIKRMGSMHFWRQLVKAKPQIIHTIGQPTNSSLIFTYLFGKVHGKASTVISALRPEGYFASGKRGIRQRRLIDLVKPDLFLVQSAQAQEQFREMGCSVTIVPNGVDLERFLPATAGEKVVLRAKYGLDPNMPLVLHVGHLEPARNLMALEQLPKAGIQVVIAGSVYMGTDDALIKRLEDADFTVYKGYQPNVEELYKLSDCYIFPVPPGNSLTMPLSVLEAMACNLPVITTRFPGLTTAFESDRGISYVDKTKNLLDQVQELLASTTPPMTREMVSVYSWQNIVGDQIRPHYQDLLAI